MAGSGGENGMATAVELLGGFGDLGLGGGEEQIDAFADADDAPLPMPDAPRTGRAGRPKGARNRSTEEWRRHMLSRYRSPLVFLAEMWSRTPAELAQQLGLYKFHEGKLVTVRVRNPDTGEERDEPVLATGEAAAMQQSAAIAALPYLHQKLPQAVEISTPPRRGVFVFGELPTGGGQDDQALPLPPLPAHSEIVRNQEVSEAEVVQSDDDQSDGLANALSYKDDLSNDD
ncbi:MAG TPA: hypothetical protein PK857_00520 [Hyphomicrobium sp.]|nr:hypothetical protein [Hyphomicrobium sp.]HRO48776.1 hypothetical protein [Hyphomicrobium sp.]